ncbi:MAG TPA: CGNR zinc finger domain-containing protein [Solirubrobacteraceae bacterium]|nr:CGNR zinc finger domain-containing protein [Solirubrobacteraceae bacterium]
MVELSESATNPDVLLRVANLTAPVKPVGALRTQPDPFSSPASLAQALGLERVQGAQIESLRAVHAVVVDLVDCLLAGRPVAEHAERLTRLAHATVATVRLESGRDRLVQSRLDWTDPDPASALARRLIYELGAIEISRLRRCARPECDLVFYDDSRSATRRWHAESPCGIRERQRRHRERGRREPA